ncbi:MAG: RIP metalloprotease RseP [Blautia sp.]|nr:RIP metalloprotease RseP [Blautia sp.]MDY5031505.1 RIP metalloprotease RseP [Blautia sp.]
MSIILALLIFSAVILFHELGHFLLAKKNGIVVTEFSLGMGPRLFSTVKNGTRYSLKALPLGGSCAMLGEDTAEDEEKGTFNAASVWGRISVVAAGPVFNFILALIFATVIVALAGYDPAEIMEVKEGSSAEQAGLQEGDIITEFQGYHIDLGRDLYVYTYLNEVTSDSISMKVNRDGETIEICYQPDENIRYLLGFNRSDSSSMKVDSLISGLPLEEAGVQPGDVITGINGVKIENGEDYDAYLEEHPLSETPVDIVYERDGLEYEAQITPAKYSSPDMGFSYNVGSVKARGLQVLKYGLIEVKYMIRTTLLSLKELVTGGLGMQDLSGPVGVVDAIGQTYEQSKSEGALIVLLNMLNMVVLLSANLGVMNLLPIPALDGGRLVFLVLEAVRRKPVNREIEGRIHFAGLMLLMMLMVFVMYNDIMKLI